MSAPPWVFACIFSLVNAWHADRTQEKVSLTPKPPSPSQTQSTQLTNPSQIWHIYGPIFMGLVGFIISMSTLNVAARYIALFLQAGSYAGFIVFYSWISSSFPRPPAKRAVALALINAFSQLGNIAGSYVWGLKENGYRKSYGIVTAMYGITIVGFWIFRMILVNLNKKLEIKEAEWDAQNSEQQGDVAFMESADESLRMRKGFRYLI
jgi:MFS family permease